jgi:hypothetical protein
MADIKSKWPWPQNVGVLGTFPEEMKEAQRLEKNPEAAPMPEVAPTRLLGPKKSSDNLRMGEPAPVGDQAEVANLPLTHVVLRRVLMRRKNKAWGLFERAVDDEELDDLPEKRRAQMRAMLGREAAMLELLQRYNTLAEDVYNRLLANSKG